MKRSINRKGWILGLTAALVLAACGPGDLPETSAEDMTENKKESTTENTVVDTTEDTTEAATEELTSAVELSSSEEDTPLATEEDTQDWGEPSQVLSGDWNEDGQEDVLESYWEDIEGGIHGIGIQLQISGTEAPGIVWAHDNGVLEEVLNGDLDGDGEQEIVIVFDKLGSGACGAYGLILLDHIEDEWIAVTEDKLFSGFTYQVNYEEATHSYLVQGAESGKEYRLPWDSELQDPAYTSGRATPFYNWTMVNGTEQDYLELWQYVAGECTVDHVGDMVTTIALQDGVIQLKDEIAVQETLTLCKVKSVGDQLEILPIEHVYDVNAKRLEELTNDGWDLEQLFHDDVQGYYEIPYEEKKITAVLTEDTRYYHWFYSIHMIRVDKEEMHFVDQDISKSGHYRVFLEGNQVVCIMWDSRQ